jgi:tetratricopeptide (TPR) repeat protein
MNQRSRTPAGLILLLTFLLGAGYVWSTRVEGRVGTGQTLEQLEQAIANPDATTETWLHYAQCLQHERRYDHAVLAYQRVLETDPYSRAANFQCVAALALLGDGDRLHSFLVKLIQLDPRLALDVFTRPELQPYLKQSRFAEAHKQAVVQAMD